MGSSKKLAPNKNSQDKIMLSSKKSGSVKKAKAMQSLSRATPKDLQSSKKILASSVGSTKINGKSETKSKRKQQEDMSDESDNEDDDDDDEDDDDEDDSDSMEIDDSSDDNSDNEENNSDDDDEEDDDEDDDDDDEEEDDDDDDEETEKSVKKDKKKKSTSEDKNDKKSTKKDKSASTKSEPIEDNSNRTLFVSRLKKGITSDQLKAFVISKGYAVVECRKVANAAFGFVQFGTITELDMAVSTLNGAKFGESTICVAKSKPPGAKKVEREAKSKDKSTPEAESRKAKKSKKRLEKKNLKQDQTSLFVKNIGQSATKEIIMKQFPGATKVIISKKPGGATRGFALVRFETEEAVEEALKKHQGMTLDGRQLLIDRAGVFAKNKPTTKKADARDVEKPSITVDSDESSDEE